MNVARKALIADASLLLVTLFWGTTFPLVKFFLTDIDPIVSTFFRFLIATAVLFPVLLVTKLKDVKKSAAESFATGLWEGLILGVLTAIAFLCQMGGLRYTTASNSAFVTSLFVVFVPLFGKIIWKRRLTTMRLVAVLLAVTGLWLLTGGVHAANFGDVLTLGTALVWGLIVNLLDIYSKRIDDLLMLSFHQLWVVVIISGIFALATGESFIVTANGAWGATIYMALFPTLAAIVVQAFAQKHTTPMRATLIFILEPVIATLIAWEWLGEKLIEAQIFGMGLILAAVMVSELPLERMMNRDRSPTLRPD